MSTLALEIEQELQTLEPESALHFERAVREMLLLAKRKAHQTNESSIRPKPYETEARALGLKVGLGYDHVNELLDSAEGDDWK